MGIDIFGILGVAETVIDKIFPDADERAKAKLKLHTLKQEGELKELEASMSVIVAEAQGHSAIQRNWRPITMLCFVAIIANNYILYPYLSLFWTDAPILELPPQMWDLLKIGIGGYIASRGGEQMMKTWKAK